MPNRIKKRDPIAEVLRHNKRLAVSVETLTRVALGVPLRFFEDGLPISATQTFRELFTLANKPATPEEEDPPTLESPSGNSGDEHLSAPTSDNDIQ